MATRGSGGIQFMPTGFESVAQGLQQLGAGLGQSIFGEEQRQRAFVDHMRANPQALREFQSMAHTAEFVGGDEAVDALAAQLELPSGFVRDLGASYQPTFQEQADLLAVSRGLPDREVVRLGADIEAGIEEVALRRDEIRAARNVLQLEEEAGLPQLRVNYERAATLAGISQEEFNREVMDEYKDMLMSMPEGHMREAAFNAIGNPQFLAHMQFHEQMALEERIAMMRMQADQMVDPFERFVAQWELSSDMRDKARQAVNDYQAALELRGDERENAIQAALAQMTEVRDQQLAATRHGFMLPTNVLQSELVARGFRGRPDLEIFMEPMESREMQAARMIISGERTMQELLESDQWGGTGGMVPFDRSEFARAMGEIQHAMQEDATRQLREAVESGPTGAGMFELGAIDERSAGLPRLDQSELTAMTDSEVNAYVEELETRLEGATPGRETFELRAEIGRARRIKSSRESARRLRERGLGLRGF